ncbi:hypothetical protein D3C78_1545820 [compost metagenome]
MKMLTAMRKPICPPGSPDSMCSIHRPPLTPWNTRENAREPIRMNTTIAVMRMVEAIALLSSDHDNLLCRPASRKAPNAPMAPASVGVATAVSMPGNPPMLPSTAKISAAAGRMPRRHFPHSAQPCKVRASFGTPGTSCGRKRPSMKV